MNLWQWGQRQEDNGMDQLAIPAEYNQLSCSAEFD